MGETPFTSSLPVRTKWPRGLLPAGLAGELGIMLWRIPGEIIPERREEQEPMAQIWTRESALMNAGLYVMAQDVEPATQKVIRRFLNSVAGPVFLSTNEPWKDNDGANSTLSLFDVSKPTKVEQRDLWKLFSKSSSLRRMLHRSIER